MGRAQRVVQKAGTEDVVAQRSADDWNLWVNAAAQVAAIADKEGIVVDHRSWVGQIAPDPAIADTVAERSCSAFMTSVCAASDAQSCLRSLPRSRAAIRR